MSIPRAETVNHSEPDMNIFKAKNQNQERGAAMLEYCLLGSLIAVALIAAVGSVGDATKDVYKEVGDTIAGNTNINPPAF